MIPASGRSGATRRLISPNRLVSDARPWGRDWHTMEQTGQVMAGWAEASIFMVGDTTAHCSLSSARLSNDRRWTCGPRRSVGLPIPAPFGVSADTENAERGQREGSRRGEQCQGGKEDRQCVYEASFIAYGV
ncbi:hypothetical protein ACMYSQ_008963 [Aspergillus niger]